MTYKVDFEAKYVPPFGRSQKTLSLIAHMRKKLPLDTTCIHFDWLKRGWAEEEGRQIRTDDRSLVDFNSSRKRRNLDIRSTLLACIWQDAREEGHRQEV